MLFYFACCCKTQKQQHWWHKLGYELIWQLRDINRGDTPSGDTKKWTFFGAFFSALFLVCLKPRLQWWFPFKKSSKNDPKNGFWNFRKSQTPPVRECSKNGYQPWLASNFEVSSGGVSLLFLSLIQQIKNIWHPWYYEF